MNGKFESIILYLTCFHCTENSNWLLSLHFVYTVQKKIIYKTTVCNPIHHLLEFVKSTFEVADFLVVDLLPFTGYKMQELTN